MARLAGAFFLACVFVFVSGSGLNYYNLRALGDGVARAARRGDRVQLPQVSISVAVKIGNAARDLRDLRGSRRESIKII